MEKFFNIAGPCVAADHYMLPATERVPEIMGLIRRKLYFVVHAPRQSGKTTALKQLVRNNKDYKMRIRPDGASVGQASPFNVITKVLPMRLFSEDEMRALYAQHTTETGQVFEEGALTEAYRLSGGQPYLVNALARWCVEEIHHEDYSQPITAADMDEAKEKIIRERSGFLNSIWKRTDDERYVRVIERIEQGLPMSDAVFDKEAYRFAEALGVAAGGHITPRYSNLIVRAAVSAFQKSEYGVAS